MQDMSLEEWNEPRAIAALATHRARNAQPHVEPERQCAEDQEEEPSQGPDPL